VRADLARLVAAVPPDLVAVLATPTGAVEVAHGEVFDPDVAGFDRFDPVGAFRRRFVLTVDDHAVAVHATQVQSPLGIRDLHFFVVDARFHEHPAVLRRGADGFLDRFEVVRVGRDAFRRFALADDVDVLAGPRGACRCPQADQRE
jgi:hypothetical protein